MSFYYLYADALQTEEDIVNKYKDHGNEAKRLHFAAVKIQSAYRGYLVRKEIKRWNRLATLIQKTFRGWLVRYHLPDALHEHYDRVNLNYYNTMATKIQALWKGYQVRKEICIKEILKQRAAINAANEEIKKQMKEQKKKNYVLRNKFHIEKMFSVLFDRHHILRTYQKEGILSLHDTHELSALEKFLAAMQWKPYMDKLREIYGLFYKDKEEYERIFYKKHPPRDEKCCLRKAPKVPISKPNYGIHKAPFQLTNKLEKKTYSRLLASEETYRVYPKDIARTEDKSKHISDQDFNLYTLKMVANEADVPPYYVDIWFDKCRIHSLL